MVKQDFVDNLQKELKDGCEIQLSEDEYKKIFDFLEVEFYGMLDFINEKEFKKQYTYLFKRLYSTILSEKDVQT